MSFLVGLFKKKFSCATEVVQGWLLLGIKSAGLWHCSDLHAESHVWFDLGSKSIVVKISLFNFNAN